MPTRAAVGARPLEGKRILITRPAAQAGELRALVEDAGGVPIELPVIEIRPPAEWSQVDAAIRSVSGYDWLVFTSVNAVRLWMTRMSELQESLSGLSFVKLACIGPGTARALSTYGITADLVPRTYVAESLLEALLEIGVRGRRILLPRAAEARAILREGLMAAGADVTQVSLYTTEPAGGADAAAVHASRPDVITFTSSSTVRNFVALAGEDYVTVPGGVVVACIGPVTAATARELGLRVDVVAEVHTMPGLIDGVERYFDRNRG